MLSSYSISGRLLLNLCIMSHRGNHLSVLYDKIPVFYALKYPKFTTITFYSSSWRPNPLLTLPNCTVSLLDGMRILTISGTNMKVSRVKQPIKRRLKVRNCWRRNIDGENLHIFWTTWEILMMTFSGKIWLMIILKLTLKKSKKNRAWFSLSKKYIFGKTRGRMSNSTPQPIKD